MLRKVCSITVSCLLVTAIASTNAMAGKLGLNVSPTHKFASAIPFIDIFKISRGWLTSCEFNWQTKQPIDPGCSRKNSFNTRESEKLELDRYGWVRRLPKRNEAPIFTSINSIWTLPKKFPTGGYRVLYDGDGDISVHGDLKVMHEQPGLIDFDLKSPKRNLRVHIKSTDPQGNGNYIRNIRVIPHAFLQIANQQTLNPHYVNRIRAFQTLRFMTWMKTVYRKDISWNTRVLPQSAHYTGYNGAPIEVMVDLSNMTHSDPWFSLPHKATDGYMANFANLVKSKLHPSRKVYVELSNEVWNGLYTATHYAGTKAHQLWPRAYPKENAGTRKILMAINWYAKRSVELCNIWKRQFGQQSNRVVCVVSTYAGAPRFGKELLSCPLAGGDCGKKVDAFAIGPYFGDYIARIENRALVKRWVNEPDGGMNSLFREIMQGGLVQDKYPGGAIERTVEARIKPNVALAREYGLPLLAYEAGQHLLRVDPPHTIKDPRVLEMFMKANSDPRMKNAYRKYLHAWQRNGGDTLLHFYGIGETDSRNFFSMLDYVGERTSPRYEALMDYLRGR